MEIRAVVSRGKGQFKVENLTLSAPGKGEVLVKLTACGICHTDEAMLNRETRPQVGFVMGHEGAGVVEAVGAECKEFAVGDHVILAFPSCGCCTPCQDGHPYACAQTPKLFFDGSSTEGKQKISDGTSDEIGVFFGQGSLSTYSVVSERNAVKVPKEADLREICGLACGLQTGSGTVLNRMEPKQGSSIAVFGCGAVGLSGVMAAKIAGCKTIIAVDLLQSRLDTALDCGATHVINGKDSELLTKIMQITNGAGVNFVLEASGATVLYETILDSLSILGLCVVVGMTNGKIVPINTEGKLMHKCATLAGLLEGGSNPKEFIPKMVKYYMDGKFPLDKLVEFYPFDRIEEAFEDGRSGKTIKPVVVF